MMGRASTLGTISFGEHDIATGAMIQPIKQCSVFRYHEAVSRPCIAACHPKASIFATAESRQNLEFAVISTQTLICTRIRIARTRLRVSRSHGVIALRVQLIPSLLFYDLPRLVERDPAARTFGNVRRRLLVVVVLVDAEWGFSHSDPRIFNVGICFLCEWKNISC